MTEEQKAAVINSRCACAMIRAMGMHAENLYREHRGEVVAFVQKDFDDVILEEEIHWNSINDVIFGGI